MPFLRLPLALFILLASSLALHAQREKLSPEDAVIINEKYPNAKRTITCLRYIITQEGHGETARPGDLLSVLYKGMLIDGTVFNESKDPKEPFTFRLGRGMVIEGWDQGLKFMKEGGKMTLIVPYELGYGTRGSPPVPRKATLIFDIEMLKIERGSTPPPLPTPQKKGEKKKKK